MLIGTVAIAGISAAGGILEQGRDHGACLCPWLLSVLCHGRRRRVSDRFYMFRLTYLTFYGESRVDHHVEHHHPRIPHDHDRAARRACGLSVIGGFPGVPPEDGWFHQFLHRCGGAGGGG